MKELLSMRIIRDFYQIKTNLMLEKKKRILSFSDLHYGNISSLFYQEYLKDFYHHLIRSYKQKPVDAILIPGDLLFYFQSFKDTKYFEQLSKDLKNISQKLGTPVCISYGNHDLPLSPEKLAESAKRDLDLKTQLEDIFNGIYVLDNEQVSFDNLCITGFSPVRDAYNTLSMPNPALEMAYQSFQTCNFNFSKENVNVLMSHENKFFTYQENASKYKDLYEYLTLIIGGHLHDGYMPLWLQTMFRDSLKDYGIWEKIPPKIDMCRGAFKVSNQCTSSMIDSNFIIPLNSNEALSVIGRGVAKYSWFIPATPSYTEIEIIGDSRQLKR